MALLLPNAPYYAPSYFPTAYFYGGAGDSSASGPSPYNAPSYFPPAYFYGGAAGSSSPTPPASGRSPYNAPTYFAPAYFYGGAAGSTVPPAVMGTVPGRDGSCYIALATGLEGLGAFESVIFGDPTRRLALGADSHPLAVIAPKGWEEADETDPALLVRRVSFTIRIIVRGEDGDAPFGELDRLAALVEAQVDRSDLGGGCIPALTRIRAGRYQPSSQYPEWSVDLDGEFSLLVDPSTGPAVPSTLLRT